MKKIPLAIVGMACRLPGANNLEEYWELVSQGRSAIAEVPPHVLDQELYFDPRKGVRNKTYSKLAALVKTKEFDHAHCPIAQELVDAVDHCHLLMCQTAYDALRHAGYDPFNLAARNTAVYIGHAQGSEEAGNNTYGTCIEEAAEFLRAVPQFTALPKEQQDAIIAELVSDVRSRMPKTTAETDYISGHMVAGTISKAFGLTGPFLALNSACASSLQAIMMGARALQSGQVDMAIVGGASDCKSDSLVLFSAAQSMSAVGSRPFDASADGLIMGEGYVCIVMKTLERAIADGDKIQAVISGAGVASDGKGKSLWAPRKEGQLKAMQRAYEHGLDPRRLQYLEAHSTATQLGDATEVSSVTEFLQGVFPPGKKIPVTSVKANIGHTLEAAGMAGVIKAVLCMQHQVFPPAINITEINPKIDWQTAPVYVPQQVETWPVPEGGGPRRAGVNAFGIGGLNMHVVVDEYVPEAAQQQIAAAPRLGPHGVPTTIEPGSDEASLAIVGMGCIWPGALNREAFWKLLLEARDPKTNIPPGRWRADIFHDPQASGAYRTPTTLGGFITDFQYDWRRHKVPPKQVEQADPLQFMLLEAADEALADSGYHQKPFDRTRAGVIMGTEYGGEFSFQLQMALRLPEMQQIVRRSLAARGIAAEQSATIEAAFAEALLKQWPALIDESGSFSSSSLASRITKTWDLMGGAVTIDCGSASALAALNLASDMLLAGDTDMMICCAGQRSMGVPTYEIFAAGQMLDKSAQPRAPFDAGFTGVVPGEGVGVVILKRLADARRDGDKIHAIIRGTAAGHSTQWGDALQTALERSCTTANIQPQDLAAWEANGTGQKQGDLEFVASFAKTQAGGERARPAMVGSVTGQIGHATGATGMASLIKATMAVETGDMPATQGLVEPAPLVKQHATVMQTAQQRAKLEHQTADGRRFAAVSSAVKQLVYNVILERGEKLPILPPIKTQRPAVVPPAPMSQPQPTVKPASTSVLANGHTAPAKPAAATAPGQLAAQWRICRCGATNMAELKAKFQLLAQNPRDWYLLAERPFNPEQKYRLAIVADSPEGLQRKIEVAAKQLDNPAARGALEQQGIFLRKLDQQKPRIAFLFPGQGSQYAGMLQDLLATSPAAEKALRAMDTSLTRNGYPTFAQMTATDNGQLGSDVWTTQVAILVANRIVLAVLTELGIQPDVVAGHSYGEFSALLAAEAWTFDQVLAVTRARCQGIDACPTARGGMLATSAPAEFVEALVAQPPFAGNAFLANHNAADQTVIGGRSTTLQALSDSLTQQGYQAKVIAVPSPFHTPLMRDAAGPLTTALASADVRPPRVPVLSCVTNRYVSDPLEIRQNLVAHLMSPVRYVGLVQRLTQDQATVLVEVGPQQTLTRLHQKIVDAGNGMAVATDHPKRAGWESLLCAKALLECVGAFSPVVSSDRGQRKAAVQTTASSDKPQIVHFDATQLRRDKMRDAAQGNKPTAAAAASSPAVAAKASAPVAPPAPAVVKPVAPVAPVVKAPAPVVPAKPVVAARTPVVAPVTPVVKAAPVVKPTPVAVAPVAVAPAPQKNSTKTAELETFLINFVVEQTGYPPEVVELDADLEADLGIDSIKKAQLFGELQEYFDVAPSEDLTLDQFPTLRHIVRFLEQATAGQAVPTTAAPATAVVAPTPAPVAVVAPVAKPQPVAVSAPAVVAPASDRTAELEQFLVNFVVEQTGYPPEVVELDADLEADLGIDSIKKAQLFGELQEYFDVAPSDDLTLDQFPTLRHIVRFLVQATAGQATPTVVTAPAAVSAPPSPVAAPSWTAPVAPAPVFAPAVSVATLPAPVAVASNRTAELETFLVNFVVEQTGYPPEVVELDADLEADLGIDSIKKAQLFGELQEYFDVAPSDDLTLDQFPTLRHIVRFLEVATAGTPAPQVTAAPAPVAAPPQPAPVAAPVASVVAPSPAPASNRTAELETFLVNFVVEQTGYPPEVVELDADLEADLGIDSIKKAQLFGELQEYFDVAPSDDLTLDQFPTLRHIVRFLEVATSATPSLAGVAAAPPDPYASGGGVESNGHPTQGLGGRDLTISSGHGTAAVTPLTARSQATRRVLQRLADVNEDRFDAGESTLSDLPTHLHDEVVNIASEANVPLANVAAFADALAPETALVQTHGVFSAARSGRGQAMHAALLAPPLSGALARCVEPQVRYEQPEQGQAYVVVGYAGLPGGNCGVNASGVSVSLGLAAQASSGALPTSRALCQLAVVPQVLATASDLQTAVDQLQTAVSLGPWTAWLMQDSVGYRVDCDGQQLSLTAEEALPADAALRARLLSPHATGAEQGVTRVWITAGGDTLRLSPAREGGLPLGERDYDLTVLRQVSESSVTVLHGTPLVQNQQVAAPAVELPPLDLNGAICERYRLELADLPLPASTPAMFTAQGAALIVGDNFAARALQAMLRAAGIPTQLLSVRGDTEQVLASFEAHWQAAPIAHLFLMASRDSEQGNLLDADAFARRRREQVMTPYLVTQRWAQLAGESKLLDRSTLVAVTNLGGDFGFSGQVEHPEGGALSGLLKCLFIEYPILQGKQDFILKAIDAPATADPMQLAAQICRELAAKTKSYEVAYQGARRLISIARPEPATLVDNANVRVGGTWIVSGGARGITAELALALAQRFQLKLHLLGSSPLPTRDPAWQALDDEGVKQLKSRVMLEARQLGQNAPDRWAAIERALQIDRALCAYEAAGVPYVYHACDVTDRAAVQRTVEAIRASSGHVDGVLHGAGIDKACRFEKKQREAVQATLACKVDGAYHLLSLLADDAPQHFVGLGSVSGRFGGNGQTDYGLANDWLCKLAAWYQTVRPQCRAIGFHYHPWGDVGMAALPEVQARLKRMQGPEFMPKVEGVQHCVREFYASQPHTEVLITTPEYRDRFYPAELEAELAAAVAAGPITAQQVVAATASPFASAAEAPLSPDCECIAERWLSVAVESPLSQAAAFELAGGALIVGDNDVARELVQQLEAAGVPASILPVSDDVADTIARLEAQWAQQPARNLFLATSWDAAATQLADPVSCRARTQRGMLVPALVAHRWFGLVQAAAESTPPAIVAITRLGGDFGFSGQIAAPEGGALTGLLKGMYLEGTRRAADKPLIKALDFAVEESPAMVVQQTLAELATRDTEVEVGYRDARRYVTRSQTAPSAGLPERSPERGGIWVVTGGARGITCASALHLAQRYGLVLHLLGASPPPVPHAPWEHLNEAELKQYKSTVVRSAIREGRSVDDAWTPIRKDIEIRKSLQVFHDAGIEVHYHQCDMGNWQAVEQTLASVRQISGRIDGILHGAGFAKPVKSGMLDVNLTTRMYSPKTDGTLALMLYTAADAIKHFIGFGSISGRFGGNGMSDYAGANDALAKLVGWYRTWRTDCAASVLHWQTWDDTGMAVQHDAAIGAQVTLGMKYIRAKEGVFHLEKELRLGLHHAEVIIFDGHFERLFYPHHEQLTASVPASESTAVQQRPLIESVTVDDAGVSRAQVRYDASQDVFLQQHLLRGKPFLPGVVGLETLTQAASLVAPQQRVVALEEVEIVNGLLFHEAAPIDATVTMTPVDGGLRCVLTNELRNRKGIVIDPQRLCSQATLRLGQQVEPISETFPGEPPAGWLPHAYPDDGLLYHGSAFRSMKHCAFQADGGWGHIVAPPLAELGGARGDQNWCFPISVLDACVVGCGSFCWVQFGGRLEVPHGFDSLRMTRTPRAGENLLLRLHYLGTAGRHSRFHFTLFGEDQQPILQARGYRTILVGEAHG